MDKILLIDNSKVLKKHLKNTIESELGILCKSASNMSEAKSLISENRFLLAISGLVLEDAPDGEVLDYLKLCNLQTIVLTGTKQIDIDLQKYQNVIELNRKGDSGEFLHILESIENIKRNINYRVLLFSSDSALVDRVDGYLKKMMIDLKSINSLDELSEIVKSGSYKIVLFDNREDERALDIVLDGEMERELVVLPESEDRDRLIKALKTKANSYICDTKLYELFSFNLSQIIKNLDNMERVEDKRRYDWMTNLHTISYFYEIANGSYKVAKRESLVSAMVIFGIDNLNEINKKYGYQAGNELIKKISIGILEVTNDSRIAMRFSGDSIGVLDIGVFENSVLESYEAYRLELQKEPFLFEGDRIEFTISGGITTYFGSSLEEMVESAYSLLVKAKYDGKNRIVMDI